VLLSFLSVRPTTFSPPLALNNPKPADLTTSYSVAKDLSWFEDDYVPFETYMNDLTGNMVVVKGVGTVLLPTKRSPSSSGPGAHCILRLERVLHAPSVVCNILGFPITDYGVTIKFTPSSSGTITDATGRPIAFFDPLDRSGVKLCTVRLSDPPVGPKVGPSLLDPSGHYCVSTTWPDSEQRHFEAMQASAKRPRPDAVTQPRRALRPDEEPPQSRAGDSTGVTPLSATERQWLKKHYGSEFHFLSAYGLSIFSDDDRQDGREILRKMIMTVDEEISGDNV
jgi:hypothetical protein